MKDIWQMWILTPELEWKLHDFFDSELQAKLQKDYGNLPECKEYKIIKVLEVEQ